MIPVVNHCSVRISTKTDKTFIDCTLEHYYFRENDRVRHVRIFTKEESGHLQYYSNEKSVYNSLKDMINDVKQKQGRITAGLGKQVILTEHVPTEQTCDK